MAADRSRKVTPWDDYDYEPRLIDFWETFGLVAGYTGYTGWKWNLNRPLTSTRKFGMLGICLLTGFLVTKGAVGIRNKYTKSRQIYIEDFIDQNPDDFVEATPKKYKDLLLPWRPHR